MRRTPTKRWLLGALCCTALVGARCGGVPDEPEIPESFNPTTTTSTTTTSTSSGGGAVVMSGADLFRCDTQSSCPLRCSSGSWVGGCPGEEPVDTSELAGCWKEHGEGREPALLKRRERPGPGACFDWEYLTLVLGNGQAVTQVRERDCQGDCSAKCTARWTVYQQEICDVEACAGDCVGPFIENCEPLGEELTCKDLAQLFPNGEGGAGGAAGAGGAKP